MRICASQLAGYFGEIPRQQGDEETCQPRIDSAAAGADKRVRALHDFPIAMGRFREHDLLTTEAHAFRESVGSAARTLRDLQPVDLKDAWLFAEIQADLALRAWFSAS